MQALEYLCFWVQIVIMNEVVRITFTIMFKKICFNIEFASNRRVGND